MTQKKTKTETEPPYILPTPQQITETLLDLLDVGEDIEAYADIFDGIHPDKSTSFDNDMHRELKQACNTLQSVVMMLQAARATLEQQLENRDNGTLRHQIRNFLRENRLPIIELAQHLGIHPQGAANIVHGEAEISLRIARKIVEFMELKGGEK